MSDTSIRTPRVGGDSHDIEFCAKYAISIRTPAWGVTGDVASAVEST